MKGEVGRKGCRTSGEVRKDAYSGQPVFQALQKRWCTDFFSWCTGLKVSVLRAWGAADLL